MKWAHGQGWELRCGVWQRALRNVETIDAIITDPPYSERTHAGVIPAGDRYDGVEKRDVEYNFWTEQDAIDFVEYWSPRCRGWMVILTDSDLAKVIRDAYESVGRCSFAPVPCITRGGRVRLAGDGPSCWTVWALVARPRGGGFEHWGTLPGEYRGSREKQDVIGGKPVWLMRALVRDYSEPDDLVCDPFAGAGTTFVGALKEGRRAIGSEMDKERFSIATKRLKKGYTRSLFVS